MKIRDPSFPIIVMLILAPYLAITIAITSFEYANSRKDQPATQKLVTRPVDAKWKVYTSAKARYSISYPDFMKYQSRDYEAPNGSGYVSYDAWLSSDFSVHIISYHPTVNPGTEFHEEPGPDETISLLGHRTTKRVSKDGSLTHIGPITQGGLSYMINFSSTADPDTTIFDQMVSSFRIDN